MYKLTGPTISVVLHSSINIYVCDQVHDQVLLVTLSYSCTLIAGLKGDIYEKWKTNTHDIIDNLRKVQQRLYQHGFLHLELVMEPLSSLVPSPMSIYIYIY